MCQASKHMKCTLKCTIQVHELASPTCVLKILIDPFPLSYLSPYVKFSPLLSFHYLSTLISLFFSPCTNIFVFSLPLSSMTTKVQNVDRLRLSMLINVGEDHFPKFGLIQIIYQRYLTRFDPRTSFFTPSNKGYLVPC